MGLNVYYQNVRGMRTKLADLRQTIACSAISYDIIILVETWLNDGFSDSEIGLDNYKIYRCDRSKFSSAFYRGGDVLKAVRNTLQSIKIDTTSGIVEQIFTVILFGCSSLLFGAVYLPPSSPASLYEDYCNGVTDILDQQ